jgi:hypothetical protein
METCPIPTAAGLANGSSLETFKTPARKRKPGAMAGLKVACETEKEAEAGVENLWRRRRVVERKLPGGAFQLLSRLLQSLCAAAPC